MSRITEVGVRVWAIIQVLVAALWLAGPYTPVGLGLDVVPERLQGLLVPTLLDGLFTGPIVGARLTDDYTQAQILAATDHINVTPTGPVSGAFGDINLGWSVQFSQLSTAQGWIWVALHVLPLLATAVMWWMLARAVAQARRETVFTERNRRWLIGGGVALAAGAPLLSIATWKFYGALANSPQLADRVSVPGYSVAHLPWTAIATGIALIALGQAWRRAAALEDDLGGLV